MRNILAPEGKDKLVADEAVEATSPARAGLKRRFAHAVCGQVVARDERRSPSTRPFSIRLSEAERQSLERAAAGIPLGAFVRARLLDAPTRRKGGRRPAHDAAKLGQILGKLGRSGLMSGLTALGAAARQGTIALTPDLEVEVRAAIADVHEVRRLLFQALGVTAEGGR